MYHVKRLFFKLCRLLYKIIGVVSPLFRTLVIHSDIKALEKNEKYDEARKLRHNSLKTLNKKYHAPLWKQEGFDLLYQVKDYQLSLVAFENAIECLDHSTGLYGVANPLDIYFGASMAAINANRKDKAQKHYNEFTKLFDSYSKDPELKNALRHYKKGMSWIEQHLPQHTENIQYTG